MTAFTLATAGAALLVACDARRAVWRLRRPHPTNARGLEWIDRYVGRDPRNP